MGTEEKKVCSERKKMWILMKLDESEETAVVGFVELIEVIRTTAMGLECLEEGSCSRKKEFCSELLMCRGQFRLEWKKILGEKLKL